MTIKIKSLLNSDRPGFSGTNHVLIAIMLFFILLIIPIEPFSSFIKSFLVSPVTGVMCFLVICGAALLPDMDNLKSDGGSVASWDLGALGSIISSIMVTISSVVTSIFHGKRDVVPNTQHRFFWHTLFVPVVMFILMKILVPSTDTRVFDLFVPFSIDTFPTAIFICLLLIGISVYIGSSLLLKKLKKLPFIRFSPSMLSLILMVASIIVCVFLSTDSQVKLMSYCVAIGYLFHLIGDLFADGGIPALFPITGIFGKFFMRIKLLPATVKTGSTLESLLKIVFIVIDILLAYMVFTASSNIDISNIGNLSSLL